MITVTFWGTRGSIPTAFDSAAQHETLISALAQAGPDDVGSRAAAEAYLARAGGLHLHQRHGGDTTCVEFQNSGGGRIIIDFGSGARRFGGAAIGEDGPVSGRPFSFLMTHMHWDHVQGFPFFAPCFIPGNEIRISGGHGSAALKDALFGQMKPPYFPVPVEAMRADISFPEVPADEPFELEGFQVTPFLLRHGDGSYGYRLEFDGASVVFASDAEHDLNDLVPEYAYVKWTKGADLLIFDAQYSLADLVLHKEDWGHSSGLVAVDLAHLADVKQVLLTHHDPSASDEDIDGIAQQTLEYEEMLRDGGASAIDVRAAFDGLKVEVGL